jgi:hypothetical protein
MTTLCILSVLITSAIITIGLCQSARIADDAAREMDQDGGGR